MGGCLQKIPILKKEPKNQVKPEKRTNKPLMSRKSPNMVKKQLKNEYL